MKADTLSLSHERVDDIPLLLGFMRRTQERLSSMSFTHLQFHRGDVMLVYNLRAYWGPRNETIHACADRLVRFLTALSACDAVFSRWYKRGMSRRKALQAEIDFGKKDDLLELLEKGRNRTDIDKNVIEELGFHVGIWNGETATKAVGLDVSCGSYTTGPAAGNCVVVDLPEELGDLRDAERMRRVLVAVAKCWEPDSAHVSSLGVTGGPLGGHREKSLPVDELAVGV